VIRRPPGLLVNFAIVWIVGLVLRSALSLAIMGSALPGAGLPEFERIGLLCWGFIATSPGVFVIAVCLTGIGAAPRFSRPVGTALRWSCWSVAYGLQLFGFTSWAVYHATGQFVNLDAWSLAESSPALLLVHVAQVEPWALALVPAAAAAVLFGTWRLCQVVFEWSPRRARGMVGGLGALLATALCVAWAGDVASKREQPRVSLTEARGPESAHAAYVDIAQERSGPISSILADAWERLSRIGARFAVIAGVGSLAGRPVIEGDRYLRTARRGDMHHWNVIVLVVESLRADELTTLGGRRVVMPELDELALEGTVYADAIAPAGQTDYATTSILSSQFPLRHQSFQAFPQHIAYPRVLLFDVLKPLGWRTAVFSSQNEHWAGMYDFLQTGGIEHFHHSDTFAGPTYTPETDRGFRRWMQTTGHAGKVDDRYTIDEAIAWTDSIGRGSPFVAYINLQSSHTPYLQPAGVRPRFGTGRVSFPVLFDVYPADSAGAVRDLYDNSLAYADAQIGRLVAALQRNGRWNSTIMVVIGDHGEAFFEHGFAAHGSELYGEVTHVPLVIRAPGARPARDDLPASGLDIAPTVLGLLGLPPHPAFQGMDLADRAARLHRPVFTLSQTALADEVAVEQDGWKIMYDLRHSLVRLFDLQRDPRESHDVAEAFPAQRAALLQTIATWWTTQLDYYRTNPGEQRTYAPPPPSPPALKPAAQRD
jgi:arylsulfatase A-like enzyme